MALKTHSDEAISKIVLGNSYVSQKALKSTREFRDKHHPNKDLAEALLLKGHLTKPQLAMVRRLVKMNRRGDSASLKKQKASSAPPPLIQEAVASEDETKLLKASPGHKSLTQCGRYTLKEKIARGGMGVIYSAVHPDLDKDFAVKVLIDGLDAPAEAIERFRREAKAAARLNHPGIVRVYDCGTEEGFPYLVMDFVKGRPLDEIIKNDGVAPRRAAQITFQMAEGLDHAHKQNLVHRDIKPGNVLIDQEGQALITDFGIVKELTGDAKLTRTGFTLGSPCYMSPEQAVGDHDLIGPESDVYSMGATLYEMLVGVPPFQGDSIHVIMQKVVDEEPLPPRSLNPAIPLDLECIVLKAMEKEIHLRYPTARDFSLDLQAFLKGDPVSAKPASAMALVRRGVKRNKVAVGFSTLLVLVVLAFTGIFINIRLSDRAERLAEAEGHAHRARAYIDEVQELHKNGKTYEERLKYYDAINAYEAALQLQPDDPAIKAERNQAILALGDRLLESNLFEFAYFVLRRHDDYESNSDIKEKVYVAQKSEWVNRAKAQADQGAYDDAIKIYEMAINYFRSVRLNASFFESEVKRLKIERKAKSLKNKVSSAIQLASDNLKQGQKIGALEAYTTIINVKGIPESVTLAYKKLVKELDTELANSIEKAQNERSRFVSSQGQGSFSKQCQSTVIKMLKVADDHLAKAKAIRKSLKFRPNSPSVRLASNLYKKGRELSEAASVKDLLEKARRKALDLKAESFSSKTMTEARNFEREGDNHFKDQKYSLAAKKYNQAYHAYTSAGDKARSEFDLSRIRFLAQEVKEKTIKALPKNLMTKTLKKALKQAKEAETQYRQSNFRIAKDLFKTATALLKKVLASAAFINEGHLLKKKVLKLIQQCQSDFAIDYAKSSYEDGLISFREGEGYFNLEKYDEAITKYTLASNFLNRAAKRAATKAKPRHASNVAKARALQARDKAIKQGKKDSYPFIDASKDVKNAEKYESAKKWSYATKYWDKAYDHYLKALGIK
ncbi:MAG: protein kinase [Planctomycetota bacterium]|nr:protein kinase [Planctomycetota bacterium]